MMNTSRCTGVSLLLFLSGCGTGLNQTLIQAGESGALTFLDVFVSDLYSDLPDLFTLPATVAGDADDAEPDDAADDALPDDVADGEDADDGFTGDDPDDVASDEDEDEVEDDGMIDIGGGPAVDAVSGEAIFVASFCSGCHCVDASGGCLPSAPSLHDVSVAILQEYLQGDTSHLGGKFPGLTGQALADVAAFLSSF